MSADLPTLGPTVRRLRADLQLSQRAFGERVGTSGPTVAAYERGTKEPRWSTVARMAAEAGFTIEPVVRLADRGARQRDRRQRRRRAVAAATAASVADDWPTAEAMARGNLGRMRATAGGGAQGWIEAWSDLLDAGPVAVGRQLLASGDEADDMRQMTPFAGLLTEPERRAALAAADAVA